MEFVDVIKEHHQDALEAFGRAVLYQTAVLTASLVLLLIVLTYLVPSVDCLLIPIVLRALQRPAVREAVIRQNSDGRAEESSTTTKDEGAPSAIMSPSPSPASSSLFEALQEQHAPLLVEEKTKEAYGSTNTDDNSDQKKDEVVDNTRKHAAAMLEQHHEQQDDTLQSELKSDYDSKAQSAAAAAAADAMQHVEGVHCTSTIDAQLSKKKKSNDEQPVLLYRDKSTDSFVLPPVRLNMKRSNKPVVEMPKAALEDPAVIGTTFVLGSMTSTSCPSSPSTLSLKSVTPPLIDANDDDDNDVLAIPLMVVDSSKKNYKKSLDNDDDSDDDDDSSSFEC